ncbi:MAG: M36 family metallopeptidase, partial [bacterium]
MTHSLRLTRRLRFLKHTTNYTGVVLALVMTMTQGVALAADHQAATVGPADEPHHFDARVAFNRGFKQTPLAASLQAATAMAREVRDLAVTYDDTTGAVRSLSNHAGYLSEGKRGPDALSVAMDFVRANLTSLGLSPADLENYEVTDRVYSKVTGATHIYLRQRYQGLPVFNGQLHVNVNRDGRIISINNSCMPGLAGAARAVATARPAVDLASAVKNAARHLGLPLERAPLTLRSATDMRGVTSVDQSRISLRPIDGRLMWLPIRKGMMNLVWNFQIHTLDKQHIYDLTVDATSGQVWTRFDWTAQDQY